MAIRRRPTTDTATAGTRAPRFPWLPCEPKKNALAADGVMFLVGGEGRAQEKLNRSLPAEGSGADVLVQELRRFCEWRSWRVLVCCLHAACLFSTVWLFFFLVQCWRCLTLAVAVSVEELRVVFPSPMYEYK